MCLKYLKVPNKAHQARHFVAGPPLRRLFCGLTLTLPQNNQLRSGPCARRYAYRG